MRHHPPITAGHLDVASPLKLFASACARGLTGTLTLRRDRFEKRIYFYEGRLVGADSNQPSESLGTLLVCQGWIDVQTYAASLSKMDEGGRKHGEILVDLGALRNERLAQALRLQSLARLCDAGTWAHGTYAFRAGNPHRRSKPYPLWNVMQSAVLQKHGRAKVIESARARADAVCLLKPSVLTNTLVSLGEPLAVMGRIDGKHTVGELVRQSENQLLLYVNLLALRALDVVGFVEKRDGEHATSCAPQRQSTAVRALTAAVQR